MNHEESRKEALIQTDKIKDESIACRQSNVLDAVTPTLAVPCLPGI
jgi:hypothetical protein